MIATPKPHSETVPTWHKPFLEMLPTIQRLARHAFRRLDPEAQAEAVEEVVASCFVAYCRLVELDKGDLIYPTPLAMYAVRQFWAGRRVGTKANVNDITSPCAKATRGIRVGRLDHLNHETGLWREILLEDRRAGPAEIAASRIDFAAWLRSLPGRYRKIATTLAIGESTKETARKFEISSSRVSQLRREFKQSWETFQGEAQADLAVA